MERESVFKSRPDVTVSYTPGCRDRANRGSRKGKESRWRKIRRFGLYEPSEEFAREANVNDASVYEEAEQDYEGFWAKRAGELHWFQEWDQVLDWDPPEAKWFVGGKTNVSYNCLDYQVEQGRGDKTAILWEGDEPGDSRTFTYSELLAEVEKFANVLKALGVEKGDPVAIYLPMIPELPISMLACARIGAPHSVVFGAFSADSLRDRINDCRGEGARHRRRRAAGRQGDTLEGQRRRGPRGHAFDRERGRRSALGRGGGHDGGSRPILERANGRG